MLVDQPVFEVALEALDRIELGVKGEKKIRPALGGSYNTEAL